MSDVNKENVEFAISIMGQAKKLDMCSFQDGPVDEVDSIDKLHACGNTACFVGYLILTDRYKEFVYKEFGKGHLISSDGTIDEWNNADDFYNSPEYYLGKFLNIDYDLAHAFIYGYSEDYDENFYAVPFREVKPEHVITKLEELLV